jgi:RNA methyltransferase, TrmH family
LEHITSKNNRWIRLAIRLKQKKYRDKNKMFLMEGIRNAEDVQNQEISDIVCLVQSGRAENGSVQHIFERGENLHWLFCEVEEPLMRLISGTENGQGIILLVKQPYVMDYPQLLNGLHGKYVLLDTVQDPGNVGAIIREKFFRCQ